MDNKEKLRPSQPSEGLEQVARILSDRMHKIWQEYRGEYSLSYEHVLVILARHFSGGKGARSYLLEQIYYTLQQSKAAAFAEFDAKGTDFALGELMDKMTKSAALSGGSEGQVKKDK